MKHYISIILAIALSINLAHGQKAMKHEKQQTTFLYAQLNLHGGYMHNINGGNWGVASRSPQNQIALQLFSKNKKALQKGYIEKFSLVSYKARVSLVYDKNVNSQGYEQSIFHFKLLDTWLKCGTKWDRTALWVGNKSIPYCHNPKLDPVFSFMTNVIKMELGFQQDLGVFFKKSATLKTSKVAVQSRARQTIRRVRVLSISHTEWSDSRCN